jgi:TolB-like protein/Flp pilus assembly protein TadD
MDFSRQRAAWTIALAGLALGVALLAIVARTERPVRIRSLAVLPFANLSGDAEQDSLADGVTSQLIATLSKIKELRVIAPASAMQYKKVRKPLPAIAKELNVDALVIGSVMRTGARVRMSVRVVQVDGEKQLWLGSFDRDVRDLPAVEDEAARKIAEASHVSLILNPRQVNPEVNQLYWKGEFNRNQDGEEPVRRGIQYFEQAIQKDPGYAPAYAGMAIAYASLASVYAPPREVMPKAKAAAMKALALDDTLPDAHIALGSVHLFFDWDWSGAEAELKRAIELNPSSAQAHDLYGLYFAALQKFDPAIAEIRRARDLDPLSLRFYGDLLSTLVTAGRDDDAIRESRTALEREPNFAAAYEWMGIAYMQQRRLPEALGALEKAHQLDPNPEIALFLGQVQALAGNRAEAEKLLHQIEAVAKQRYVCKYEIAQVYTSLGQKDQAFEWLKRGADEQADCMVWLKSEPWNDPLRTDPRYAELLKRVGFSSRAAAQ